MAEKYSHLATRIAATKDVFEKEVWPELEKAYFPKGVMVGMEFVRDNLKSAFETNMLKEMKKKFGNSVYVPHQGTKEMARRVAQNAARS